jgi:hypothetical protein
VFWSTLDRPRQILLRKIVENTPVPNSYLAGGTGLALMFGHRESVDFDWFTPNQFDNEDLYRRLAQIGKVMITETKKGTFHGFVDDIQVTWLWYPNPLIEPLVKVKDMPGLSLASVMDIGLMKWVAVSQRGARKDFIDLYMICQKGINLESMLAFLPEKYPEAKINYYHMIKSLSYFEDAEREIMPIMKIDIDWEKIKDYFLQVQKKLLGKFC